jgi:hypothetical protein
MAEQDLIKQAIERRRDARRSTQHRRGIIKFGPKGTELPCTILDLTSQGAGLSVGSQPTASADPAGDLTRNTALLHHASRHDRVKDGTRIGRHTAFTLSFPKIISGRIDYAIRLRSEWPL